MNEDVSPIHNGSFPASYVSLPEGNDLQKKNSMIYEFRRKNSTCLALFVGTMRAIFVGENNTPKVKNFRQKPWEVFRFNGDVGRCAKISWKMS